MYKNLLVAVDHSEITERVLGAARDLASLSHGEVWVLHLREREVMPRAGLMARESPDEAQATVDAAVEELTAAGITARGEVRNTIFGYAAREIVADAIEHLVEAPDGRARFVPFIRGERPGFGDDAVVGEKQPALGAAPPELALRDVERDADEKAT